MHAFAFYSTAHWLNDTTLSSSSVNKTQPVFFVRFTSYGVLLRDFEWTSTTTITATATKQPNERTTAVKNEIRKAKQQTAKKKNYARFRRSAWVRKRRHTKGRKKIKLLNATTVWARWSRFYKSFRSFNLSDENHLFFLILFALSLFHTFRFICVEKATTIRFYVVIRCFIFIWFKQQQ